MKKLSVSLLALLLFFLNVNLSAQNSPFQFSIRAGVNLSNSIIDNKEADTNAKVGYQVGVNVDYLFSNQFFIESGLIFTTKGTKIKDYYAGKVTGGTGKDGDIHNFSQLYLELPVYAGYQVPITSTVTINFVAGPYFAYGVGGKTKWTLDRSVFCDGSKEKEWNTFDKEKDAANDYLKRFDMGIGFGATVDISRFIIGVGGEYGLLNIATVGENKYRNLNANLTVGYRFAL